MSEQELLADCLRRLNRAGISYYLTGSMASNYWGIPRTKSASPPDLTAKSDTLYLKTMSESVLDAPRKVRWQDADFVAEVNSRQMASSKPNPIQELWPWFKSVRLYHEAETEQTARGTPTEQERQWQKHMLSVLINVGEWLVRELRHNDVTGQLGVTLPDVEATLEELYVSQRVWFGGMTEERRKQVLDEVFGAA